MYQLDVILLKLFFFKCRVPERDTGELYFVKQGPLCLDAMGRPEGDAPGVFSCHGTGGNQVRTEMLCC